MARTAQHDAGGGSARSKATNLRAPEMKRPFATAILASLLFAASPVAAQQQSTICTSVLETTCGEFELPTGQCVGTSCFVERAAKVCAGSTGPNGSVPQATMRVLADVDDYKSGRAWSKIAAARSAMQPNQSIVRDVLFTCMPATDQTVPPVETPPDNSVKLPDAVEQVYKDIQIRAYDPYGLSTLSSKFDIVVRDTSVLSFTAGIPPFTTLVEGEETTGTIGVFGGEGQVTVGMTGAPAWMMLVPESLKNPSGRSFKEDVLANPPAGSAGTYGGIRIVAQDAAGRRTESPPFAIQVVAQDALRILGHQGDISGKVGETANGYVEARTAKKWIAFDVLGGPPGFVVEGGLQQVQGDGGAYGYNMFKLKTAGTWSNVVYRAVDDQGRKAYSAPFKVVIAAKAGGTTGLPPTIVTTAPPALGFRDPYSWTFSTTDPVVMKIDGELPPGLGPCTNGSMGICGSPTEFGKWDGTITFTNDGGGTKSIPFHFENEPSGWLKPCRGRFSPMNSMSIEEDEDSYTISNAKDRTITFCTSPYDQMDGGEWVVEGQYGYSSWYKSSSSYDFIYPSSSLSLGYSFYGNALSFPFGDPPPEAMACLGRNPFCTDNVSFDANALLGSLAPGSRAGPVYLTGRDWKGRFWGSKRIYLKN